MKKADINKSKELKFFLTVNVILFFVVALFILFGIQDLFAQPPKRLHVFSSRAPELIQPVLNAYTKETGVKVTLHTGKAEELVDRLKNENRLSAADVLLTESAASLWRAEQNKLFHGFSSQALAKNIPAQLKSQYNQWYGFSVRAHTIVYNKNKVKKASLSTYEKLADKKWKKRLCLKNSGKTSTRSLISMVILENGETKAEAIIRDWIKNLSQPVLPDDKSVLRAIAKGRCDVGIVDSYEFAKYIKKNSKAPLKIHWPNQKKGTGVHVDILGAGITKYARNRVWAFQFLDWLSEKSAQKVFTNKAMEYPANPRVRASSTLTSLGKFKPSPTPVWRWGEFKKRAIAVAERAGYLQ